MSEDALADLLARLTSADASAAWTEFLKRYSPVIMHVVHRYETGEGAATDCFLHACDALQDDGFRRLRNYRTDGPARFETWLKAVVANLCVDWRRRQHGRLRPIQSVAGLPALDQLVYRYIYMRGMSRVECLHALEPRFPGLTDERLSEINARLFAMLKPRQRWQLSARTAPVLSLDELSETDEDAAALQFEAPGPGPQDLAEFEQEQRLARAAMARLPQQQRLLLRMRYEQNLTLDEIARLTRQPDPFRVNRQIQAALAALRELVDSMEPLAGANAPDPSV